MTFTRFTNAPEIYKKWAAISGISAALQRRVFLRYAGRKLYPNLFVFLVGPPATGKTQALLPIIEILEDIPNICLSPTRVTAEKLIHLIAAETKIIPEAQGLEVQTAYSIFSEELSVLIGVQDNRFLSSLTAFFDCPTHFSYKTLSRQPAVIQNLSLTIAGGITPRAIAENIGPAIFGTGFTSRVNFIYSEEKQIVDLFAVQRPPDFGHFTADLRRINKLYGEFRFDKRAAKQFQELYATGIQPAPTDSRLEEYLGRRHLHLAKLAMIFSVSESDSLVVLPTHVDLALATLLESEAVMMNAFTGLGTSPMKDAIRAAIYWMKLEGHPVSEAALKKRLLMDVAPQHVNFLLQELVASGQVTMRGEGTSRVYLCN